jgi:hypothetical protein
MGRAGGNSLVRSSWIIPVLSLALASGSKASGEVTPEVKFKGFGWMQVGKIENSSDKVSNGSQNDFNKNWLENAGGQISAVAKLSDRWEGAFGIGAIQTNNARGALGVSNNWYAFYGTSVSEARLTYSIGSKESHSLLLNMGFFNFNYNPDVRNLGLYLLRGMPYPGTLISGFEARHVSAASNIYGINARYGFGGFKNDLLVISETDHRPYFDISIADIVTWQALPSLQFGAGASLYRILPRNAKVTSPDKGCDNVHNNYSQIDEIFGKDNELCYILDTLSRDTVANTVVVDTVLGSLGGTKLMGRFRFDPKTAFGFMGSLGKDDLVLYGEVAVLGLKDYPKYYSDIKRRIPVMIGLNLPAFGFLDKLSMEVEYFANKNYNDYGKAEAQNSWVPRVVPNVDLGRDDVKWSLYASKVVMGHLKISGQVANDHLRTFGAPDLGFLTYAEALTTPKDWYWVTKIAYYF